MALKKCEFTPESGNVDTYAVSVNLILIHGVGPGIDFHNIHFHKSFNEAKLPTPWKEGNVVPIHKKDGRQHSRKLQTN